MNSIAVRIIMNKNLKKAIKSRARQMKKQISVTKARQKRFVRNRLAFNKAFNKLINKLIKRKAINLSKDINALNLERIAINTIQSKKVSENKKPDYYHVRINPNKKGVMGDFKIFFSEVLMTGRGKWDKDWKNKIATGDYIGFITGPRGGEMIYIFKVERESIVRPTHWASNTPYTENNGNSSVSYRQVIILTNRHKLPKTWDWRFFRAVTGLGGECVSWMPRGTQRVANKKNMPFDIE